MTRGAFAVAPVSPDSVARRPFCADDTSVSPRSALASSSFTLTVPPYFCESEPTTNRSAPALGPYISSSLTISVLEKELYFRCSSTPVADVGVPRLDEVFDSGLGGLPDLSDLPADDPGDRLVDTRPYVFSSESGTAGVRFPLGVFSTEYRPRAPRPGVTSLFSSSSASAKLMMSFSSSFPYTTLSAAAYAASTSSLRTASSCPSSTLFWSSTSACDALSCDTNRSSRSLSSRSSSCCLS